MKFHQFRIENKNSSPGEYQISRNIGGKGSNRSALFEYERFSVFMREPYPMRVSPHDKRCPLDIDATIFSHSFNCYNFLDRNLQSFLFFSFFFFVSRGGRISPRIKVKRSLVKTPLPLSIPEGEEKREKVRRENFSGFCLPARRWDFFATSPPPS